MQANDLPRCDQANPGELRALCAHAISYVQIAADRGVSDPAIELANFFDYCHVRCLDAAQLG